MHQIQMLRKYGLSVRGMRGQHLLIDENVQRKFVEAVQPRLGETMIEIGPGLGAITEGLLKRGAKVIAIEQDPRYVEILRGELAHDYPNLTLAIGDILKINFRKYVKSGSQLRVVGNIPYYITSPILLRLIAERDVIDSVFLTTQKEIADRIFAQPGTKSYGRLSILVRYYADVRRLFEISRHCFSPKPNVDSTSIELSFRRTLPATFDDSVFFDLVKAGFGERRKNLVNAITDGLRRRLDKKEVQKMLREAKISEQARAEHLMIKDFMRLAEVFTSASENRECGT